MPANTRYHSAVFVVSFFLNSKLSQHSLSTGNRNLTTRLLLGIHDLPIINNERISGGALAQCPAKLRRERGPGIGEEELQLG
jgi:hypothetical protein